MASAHRADQHANGGKEHAAEHSTQGLNGSLGSLHTWEARDLGGMEGVRIATCLLAPPIPHRIAYREASCKGTHFQ